MPRTYFQEPTQAGYKFYMEKQTFENSQENSEKRKGEDKAYQILKQLQ